MESHNTEQLMLTQWRRILPSCVQISCGEISDFTPSLTEQERRSIGDTEHLRSIEFSAGRKHAHQALAAIKAEKTSIIKCHLTGKPIWPIGVIGSITHTSSKKLSHVAVAVTTSEKLSHLGIDAEIDLNLHPTLWRDFLTTDEIVELENIPIAQRNEFVNIIWCLKESAIKSSGVRDMLKITTKILDPATGTYRIIAFTTDDRLMMTGRAINTNGITLATVYKI